MPLVKSGSPAAVSRNIHEMVAAGHPHDQAVAAAMRVKDQYGRALGGATPGFGAGGPIAYALGGSMEDGKPRVPIIAAGGEYIVSPEMVRQIGGGDMKKGHEILDKFVLHVRKRTIDTMRKLKGPVKS